MVKVRDAVIFVDERGVLRPALVTAVWSETCVNLAFVNEDDAQRDDYGIKISRKSSVVHKSIQPAPGNYWHEMVK